MHNMQKQIISNKNIFKTCLTIILMKYRKSKNMHWPKIQRFIKASNKSSVMKLNLH